MIRFRLLIVAVLVLGLVTPLFAEQIMVYTANQGWFSRIYALRMDGSVITYHEYEYYIFSDMEVVDNEVYVTDWVAPRLYKVDPMTGDLDVIVDDWSLLSMYDVAWDGTHFYIDEWSLNRYDIEGDWQGNTSFDESPRGSAWDGEHYWTLNGDAQMRCWDISAWPSMVEIEENATSAPTQYCRGLWFDGDYFWTAESKDVLGRIFKFDANGAVQAEWIEPAFSGFAACIIDGPVTLSGAVVGGEFILSWTPHPEAGAYWIYGAGNEPHFEPGISPPYYHRVTSVRPNTTTWTSPNGIGSPQINWTYVVMAVDAQDQELARSDRVAEFDFGLQLSR